MDFLRDPRFSQYRSSTTMKKYFPRSGVEELSAKDNVVYKLIKSSEPTMHQKNSILKEKQVTRQKAHRTTIQTTNSRFLLHKTSQRLSTINSLFSNPALASHSPNSHYPTNHHTQTLRNQLYKLNQFTVSVERFQKSIKRSRKKVNLLKSYNTMVGNYFERFEVNEDRTRKQIVEHQEIVRLLMSKNSQDDNVAYFNAVRDKKVKESSGKKGRAKSSGDKVSVTKGTGVEALMLKEMSKVNGYKGRCEERLMGAIQKLRRSGVIGMGQASRVMRMEKVNIRGRLKEGNQNDKMKDGNQKDKIKESRFFKENKRRKNSPQENKENHIEIKQVNCKYPPTPTIKKSSITRLKQPLFNRKRPSFIFTNETSSSLNQTDQLIKQNNQISKQSIFGNDKPFRLFQKRMKTAGPFDYQEERRLIQKKLIFNNDG